MCVCVLVCVHPTPARYIELLLTLIKDPDMPRATLQIPVVAEHDVKGPLMVESGGGTLYHAVGQFEGFLYKKVKYDHDMERVWELQERWVFSSTLSGPRPSLSSVTTMGASSAT